MCGLIVHLLALVIEEFDAVVVERIVAGRNHNAAVETLVLGDEGHGGRGRYVQQVGIGTFGGDAGRECVFQHIGGTARVLANDDAGACVLVLIGEVPAEEATDFECVFCGEVHASFAAKTISSKVFSHLEFEC